MPKASHALLPLMAPIALAALAPLPLTAQLLGSGVVSSADGSPLGRVWVQELGARSGTLTRSDGVFTFALMTPATLLLVKEGFRPEIVQNTGVGGNAGLNVVLRNESVSLSLRTCKRENKELVPELELASSPRILVKRGVEADFVAYVATYTPLPDTRFVLESMTGIHVGALAPRPDWAKGLSSIAARSVGCGGVQWTDLRGVSEAGLLSRWLGYGQSYVQYSRVPKDAATAFDLAIDGGCCR